MTFTAGQRLTAAALNAAFASTPQLISTVTLAGTQATVPFSVVSGVYSRLTLYWRAMLSTTGSADITLQVDGNSGNNYSWVKNEAHNNTVTWQDSSTATNVIKIGVVSGSAASFFGSGYQMIEGWSTTTGYLTCSGTYGNFNGIGAALDWAGVANGVYETAGPHSSLTVGVSTASFAAGSVFALYGLT